MKTPVDKRKKPKLRPKSKSKPNTAKSEKSILSIYLREINYIPLMTREEENKTACAAVQGDQAARDRLINANLRFVVSIAKKYHGFGMPLTDLINEGNIGLMNAVKHYDVERGYHFISYAVWWIRQSILKALYDKVRLIRLPASQTNDLIHIERMKKKHYDSSEIAEMLNIKKNYMSDIMAISREVVSLEKMIDTGSGSVSLVNTVEDDRYDTLDEVIINKLLGDDINVLLDNLDRKEAEVIRMHYGLGEWSPMTLQEIGDQFHLSKERIRQIEEKALWHLKKMSRKTKLEAYVA